MEISEQIAHNLNTSDVEAYRIKIVNKRRAEVVRLNFELVSLRQVAGLANHVMGPRKFFVGPRRKLAVPPFKYEREVIDVRPKQLVSMMPFNRSDMKIEYAIRITTTDCPAIEKALSDNNVHLRFRVYAEHPWSARGKTFEKVYSKKSDTKIGDFVLGHEMLIQEDTDLVRRILEVKRNLNDIEERN